MSQRILDTGKSILLDQPPPRGLDSNWFNLSHDNKFSCQPGDLVPCLLLETMPGDYFKIGHELLQRLAPLATPAFQRMNTRTEFFFIPWRIIWPESNAFFGPPNSGSLPPAFPYFANVASITKSLSDYLGLPSAPGAGLNLDKVSALAHFAYQSVYDTYYKDENLNLMFNDNNPNFQCISGDNTPSYAAFNVIKKRNNDRDYFTSALPEAQKGPVVVIPVTTSNVPVTLVSNGNIQFAKDAAGTASSTGAVTVDTFGGNSFLADSVSSAVNIDPNGTLILSPADFAAHAGSIMELRAATALQRFLEADLMGGTRFDELIWQHFRVRTSNQALQYPYYIGSHTQEVHISEVLQTSESATTPQGNMAGHGITARRHDDIDYRCEEWGFIMGIQSTIPTTGYSQGIPKKFSKFDRNEFGWSEFSNLGMQAVKNREIFYTNTVTDDGDFGYLPMYSEYRIETNKLAGEFRTNLTNWTLSNLYAGLPVLGQSFLEVDPSECMRIFAVTSVLDDHLYNHAYFDIKVSRKLPKYVSPLVR